MRLVSSLANFPYLINPIQISQDVHDIISAKVGCLTSLQNKVTGQQMEYEYFSIQLGTLGLYKGEDTINERINV